MIDVSDVENELEADEAEPTSGREMLVASAAAIASVFAIGIYAIVFSSHSLGGPPSWGEFGDYFGGVVNPIVGLATVVLVVLTLRATRSEANSTRRQLSAQVRLLKRQERLTELNRRLEGLLMEWNAHLDFARVLSKFDPETYATQQGGQERTLRQVFGSRSARNSAKKWRDRSRVSDAALEKATKLFDYPVRLSTEMAMYVAEYDQFARSRYLSDYYRRRFSRPIDFMSYLGVLPIWVVDEMRVAAPRDIRSSPRDSY